MKAECTWGDGPSVLLSLDGKSMVLLEDPLVENSGFVHGKVANGQIDLTSSEARELAWTLLNAADHADLMEKSSDNISI